MLHSFVDIHTHTPGRPRSILSTPAAEVGSIILPPPVAAAGQDIDGRGNDPQLQYFSLELHPWHLTSSSVGEFRLALEHIADDPRLVAIGECGLDPLCDTPMTLQLEAFRAALSAARERRLPVIIHCVRLWAEMMAEVKRSGVEMPIVHGFRKGPALAQQLLKAGFGISLGSRFQPETLAVIPADRLYRESDED